MITLENGDFNTYLVVNDDGRDMLFQTDFDYVSLATAFGFDTHALPHPETDDDDLLDLESEQMVMQRSQQGCTHLHTDGTVKCPDCGMTVAMFIAFAMEYLDEHVGDTVEDPGYFADD